MPGSMEKCYPARGGIQLKTAGLVLLALGAVLLFVSIPCWAWWALIGLGMIVLGFVLIKLSNIWR